MEEKELDYDIWYPAIKSALADLGCNEECKIFMVWEGVSGSTTLIEFEDKIRKVAAL